MTLRGTGLCPRGSQRTRNGPVDIGSCGHHAADPYASEMELAQDSLTATEISSLRCPGCRAIEWYCDGFVIYEAPGGAVHRVRVNGSMERSAVWTCRFCDYKVGGWTVLHRGLTEIQITHLE